MFVKKFEAATLEQALAQVKTELGPDALILSSEERPGAWWNRSVYEVTAAFDKRAEESPPQSDFGDEKLMSLFPHRRLLAQDESVTSEKELDAEEHTLNADENSENKAERRLFEVPLGQGLGSNRFDKKFTDIGVSDSASRELGNRLVFEYSKKDLRVQKFLVKAMVKLMAPSMRTKTEDFLFTRRTWTLVGSSGSGKTSLAVKLALHLKKKNEKASLLSLDRRKIVGRKELAAYSRLIQVEFELPDKSKQSPTDSIRIIDCPAIESLSGPDAKVVEQASQTGGTLLVLDGRHRLAEQLKAIEKSDRYQPLALVITHIDLMENFGVLFDVIRRSGVPLLALSQSSSFKKTVGVL